MKKDNILILRISESEKESLKAKAKKEGMSEYVRKLILREIAEVTDEV